MPLILDQAGLDSLAASLPPRDAFGPGSEHPWLAVETAAISPPIALWLGQLPCVIIGLGAPHPACDTVVSDVAGLARLTPAIIAAPLAAMILVQHLRASATLTPQHALVAESLAYAAVQQGPEFRRWQERAGPGSAPEPAAAPLRVEPQGETLCITLTSPATRNAIDTAMRDALCEAFDLAAALNQPVTLAAEGRCFSTGGALGEFGQVSDPATAHWIRSLRLPAAHLLPVAERSTALVNGAAIGAGLELAAFCGRVVARPDAWFQLPELNYGLIPGAGGTVSLPRRIGRQRTAWMVLSRARVSARQALAWGLVDAIAE